MVSQADNNKRIVKNTVILYVRMIIVLLITLYSSRLVLKALGVDDFGLYNVVGGVVGLLSFFNVTMARSTQRFLNVEMVKGEEALGNIFASSITVHLLLAILFFIIGETIGLWFLNNHINIPEGREYASNLVYQASILSFCVSIISVPYSAAVIAYEKMSFVALVGIVDAVLKLLIAVYLLNASYDRLVLYGILLLLITVLNLILYYLFCKKNYKSLRFKLSFDKDNIKHIFSFVGWTLVGESAQVGCNQGNAILVNWFHPLTANAAMTVGGQINNALSSLTSNFQTAFNPQITKSYSENNYEYLKKLVYGTSKISFCILFVVAVPISFNINWILDIWLEEVPDLSNIFAILYLGNAVLNALSSPFHFAVLASGEIRSFQVVSSLFYVLDLPITYFLFFIGFPAPTVLWVKIGTMVAIVFVRIIYASKVVPTINFLEYCIEEMLPLIITLVIVVFVSLFCDSYSSTLVSRFVFTLIIETACIMLIWWVCFKKRERELLLSYLKLKNYHDK
jgi:O-antigen/teichoic acid export membrane protein